MTKLLTLLLLLLPLVLNAQRITTLSVEMVDASSAPALSGIVFEDRNGNGRFDGGVDTGVPGVGVSDGADVVMSDSSGKYALRPTADSRLVFITQPAGFERQRKFYHYLEDAAATSNTRFDFPLRRAQRADNAGVRFVQTSDIHVAGTTDTERLAAGVEEINQLTPPADFVVATGDLVNTGEKLEQFDVYRDGTEKCIVPWFHVFGNHDVNKGNVPTKNYSSYFGPDYYSADYGELHLVMLNSVHPSERQNRWLQKDVALMGKGKKLLAFQHHAPTQQQIARLQAHKVRMVFSGHWHSNKITPQGGGLVAINHPTFMMGGIDGSPSSFRIVTINGDHINSEFRFNDFEKHIRITYPQQQLTGPERLLAQIYDTTGDVAEARFRLVTREIPALAQGHLKKISPLSWMAFLDKKDLNLKDDLPQEFAIRVRATNNRGEQWEANHKVQNPQRLAAAPDVKLKGDWPQFMRTAQRTGSVDADIALPLQLKWFTPTHGCIDYGSPVLYKGRLAIGVKDRDNLINNGVQIIDAKSGRADHFVKTDSAVNHSPAFAEDDKDGPGKLYATAQGGSLYVINPSSGGVESETKLGQENERWIYSAPGVQDNMIVLGSSPMLMALDARFGTRRWVNNDGADWISSYASPTLAGPIVVMGAQWLTKDKKRKSIYALDAQSGQMRWMNECDGISGSVSVAGGRGYAIDYRGLFKVINLENGEDLHRIQLEKDWGMSTPAIDPELVVVPTGAGTIYAFDRASLEQKWKFTSGESLWRMGPYEKTKKATFSSPTITRSHVFIGCSDGKLYALGKHDGSVRWSYDFGVPQLATPCISGNALFTAAYDGTVYGFTSAKQ